MVAFTRSGPITQPPIATGYHSRASSVSSQGSGVSNGSGGTARRGFSHPQHQQQQGSVYPAVNAQKNGPVKNQAHGQGVPKATALKQQMQQMQMEKVRKERDAKAKKEEAERERREKVKKIEREREERKREMQRQQQQQRDMEKQQQSQSEPATGMDFDEDPYYGRRDVALHIERSVKTWFPVLHQDATPTGVTLGQWVAYTLFRTQLPQTTVFHSIRLLRRVSNVLQARHTSALGVSASGKQSPFLHPGNPLYHHALCLGALTMACLYHMDDSYSHRSWRIACGETFTVPQIDVIELELMAMLEWCMISRTAGETPENVIEEEEWEWECATVEAESREQAEAESETDHATVGKFYGGFDSRAAIESSLSKAVGGRAEDLDEIASQGSTPDLDMFDSSSPSDFEDPEDDDDDHVLFQGEQGHRSGSNSSSGTAYEPFFDHAIQKAIIGTRTKGSTSAMDPAIVAFGRGSTRNGSLGSRTSSSSSYSSGTGVEMDPAIVAMGRGGRYGAIGQGKRAGSGSSLGLDMGMGGGVENRKRIDPASAYQVYSQQWRGKWAA